MTDKALKLIQPISKRDQVVTSFKEAILSGIIQPGETIVESRLAQQLGAGIPLVREALIELEHHGYVQKVPYKGTTVTRLDHGDVEKIFRLRVELESLAIQWAKESVRPADIEELRGITRKMKEGANVLDLDQFYQNDLAFHRKLWEMSGNEYLVECLERIVMPLFAFFLMKDRRSIAPVEPGEIARADARCDLGLEDRSFQCGLAKRTRLDKSGLSIKPRLAGHRPAHCWDSN